MCDTGGFKMDYIQSPLKEFEESLSETQIWEIHMDSTGYASAIDRTYRTWICHRCGF